MPRVIISSGHTSLNPGVVVNGLQEYEVARKIAKYALKYIRLNGIISLSVPPNLELPQRLAWINKTGYLRETNDIAIEIHLNDGGHSGLEAWFEGDGANPSQGIANIVMDGLSKETGLPILGARSEFQHELGSIAFVHDLRPFSVVIECGFIDGDNEFLKLEANLEKCGRGIAKGILNYFGLEYREIPVINNNPNNTVASATPVVTPQAQPVAQMVTPQAQPVAQPVAQPTIRAGSDDFDEEYSDYDDGVADYNYAKTTPVNQVTSSATTANTIATPQTPTAPSNANLNALNNYAQPSAPVNNSSPMANFNNPTYSVNNGNNNASAGFPSREERKEMIIRNYVKILGREPNQNDLNYFLNIGIREDELIRKMVDSQEHVDLLNMKEEYSKIKDDYAKDKAELQQLRALTEDQKTIMDQYNHSIEQKNIALVKLQNDLTDLEQKLHSLPTAQKKASAPKTKYKGNFKDKFFKAMSDLME